MLDQEDRDRDLMRELREPHGEAEAGINRLLELKGLMDAEDPSLRERLVTLRFCRDEVAKDITDLSKRLASAEPTITSEKVNRLVVLLRDRLRDGPPDLR